MDSNIASAIIQEVGQTVHALENAGLSAVSNWKAYSRSNKQYRKMRNDAILDRQHEEWYNSPEQQMRRLQEAGLNPNLVYGNGASAGIAGNTRDVKPTNPASSFINAMGETTFVDNLIKLKQLQMMEDKNREEVNLLKSKNLGQLEVNSRLQRDNLLDTSDLDNMPRYYSGYVRSQKAGLLNYQRLGAYQGMLLRQYEAEMQREWKKYGVTSSDNFLIRSGARIGDQLRKRFGKFADSLDWDSFRNFLNNINPFK